MHVVLALQQWLWHRIIHPTADAKSFHGVVEHKYICVSWKCMTDYRVCKSVSVSPAGLNPAWNPLEGIKKPRMLQPTCMVIMKTHFYSSCSLIPDMDQCISSGALCHNKGEVHIC